MNKLQMPMPTEPRRKSDAPQPLLEMRGVSKTFPGVRALESVNFTLLDAEIHALLGENGAGKSTLIKVLTGVYRRDAGTITLAGARISPRSPLQAQSLGISTVYQEVNLVPYLSVAENIFLGREPTRWGRICWREIHQRSAVLLESLELRIDVTQPLNSYSVAIQQMVAIARALDIQARVLILDEPTSSLDTNETNQLFAVMRRLRERGLGIIFITHFLEQVYEITDRLTVLRNGKLVGTFATQSLPRIKLIGHMIGQTPDAVAQRRAHEAPPLPIERERLLCARGLGRRGAIEPLDIAIDTHEVVGLAGLLGSGRTETARLLFGADRADSGRMKIRGQEVRLRSPRQAIAQRLAFCPEDRKTDGIIPDLSVRENIILALQARRGWHRPLGRAKQRELAQHYIRTLRIATPDANKPVGQLSGGNQQKVILARWLAAEPALLIVDEPTRGIDIGAKAEIEQLINDLCRRGLAILFISSEVEETVRNCHRVVVLRDRRKVGELDRTTLSVSSIMALMAAHENDD